MIGSPGGSGTIPPYQLSSDHNDHHVADWGDPARSHPGDEGEDRHWPALGSAADASFLADNECPVCGALDVPGEPRQPCAAWCDEVGKAWRMRTSIKQFDRAKARIVARHEAAGRVA